MIDLREALTQDIAAFSRMETAKDTCRLIFPYDLETHLAEFDKESVVYLSIVDGGELIGFIILALDSDGLSVEFRRIVVTRKNKGVGQIAIRKMEAFCKEHLHCKRIWLDVFEYNERARHIYEKLDYQQFGAGEHNGKQLLYYEKAV